MLLKHIKSRFLRILIRISLGALMLFSLLILFVRSPWGQNIIVGKATNYISGKTGTKVDIDKLYLTFSGNLSLKGLYLEDEQRDTLIYSQELEVSLALIPLIRGEEINVKSIKWSGLKANVLKKISSNQFNYQFLIDAFATSPDSTEVTSAPSSDPKIRIDNVSFSDFHLKYHDESVGMNASIELGNLNLEIQKLDLEQMTFEIDELAISKSKIQYSLNKEPTILPESSDDVNASSTRLPKLSIERLTLDDVSVNYESITQQTTASLDVGALLLRLPLINLENQNILLDEFSFSDSKVFLKQIPSRSQSELDTTSTESQEFQWPEWTLAANKIELLNNQIVFQSTDSLPNPGEFNPDHMNFKKLNFRANNISLKPGEVSASLNELSFKERSGLDFQKVAFDLTINDQTASLENIDLATLSNSLSGDISLQYNSIQEFINSPISSSVSLNIDQLKVGLSELSIFRPELSKNEYVTLLSKKNLTGAINVNGKLNQLEIPEIALKWGEKTDLKLSGRIANAMDMDSLDLNLKSFDVRTTKSDLDKIIGGLDLGVDLPKNFSLSGSLAGNLSNAKANLNLKTTDGSMQLKGQFENKDQVEFKAEVNVKDLQIAKILQNPQLDTLSFTTSLNGTGSELKDLTAQLKTNFSKLSFDGYDFSNLHLEGDIKNGDGDINLAFKDRNLDMVLNTLVKLDSVTPEINTKLTVVGADLYELGLTTESIRTAFVLDANFQGNATEFDLTTKISNGVAVYEREAYNFGSLDLNVSNAQDTLNARIRSSIVDSRITANKNIAEIIPTLERQLKDYLDQIERSADATLTDDTRIKMNTVVRQAPILSEVFLQGLERMDSISFDLDYDAKNQSILAELIAPYIQYEGSVLDSLMLKVSGNQDQLSFLAGWSSVNSGPVSIDRMSLNGLIKDQLIQSTLAVYDDTERLLNIATEVSLHRDTLQLHVNPDELIFNKKPWAVSASNQLDMSSKHINLEDFELSNGVQKVTLSTSLRNQKQPHVGAIFENFQLSSITNLLNPDKPLASGILKGDLILENPFGSLGMLAEFGITDLNVMEIPFGQLNLDAQSVGAENYELALAVKGNNANLDLTGSYLSSTEGANLTLDLDLKDLQMTVLEKLSNDNISQSEGSLSGAIKVSGNTSDPIYTGTLNFNQIGFLVNRLNTQFNIAQEQLKIDNSGLYLDNFIIADGSNNNFSLGGKILTKDIYNPTFDLNLKANNFGLVNSTEDASDLFHGQMNMDADLTIQGDLAIPKVRGKVKVNDGSMLTFTIPESQLELKARDGVVLFVNRKNPDDILTRVNQNESSLLAATLSGYDIETVLSIGENAEFNVIVDEASGDNLRVTGTGDFTFALEPNGRTSLSGKYELSGGHYETNLYNLVKRRFEISPGSSISWSGDPYDAELRVKAIYNIKTSAGPLMATRTSAEGSGLESSYQERLPFQVYINVDGVLLKPEISFNLEMPETDRSALGGAVYTQVQQLNSQEEELNKQVFSLLVLNRFFPSSGSDGSNGGPASIALDNVNKVLSGQLNNYSDKLFGNTGIDVGFDLNTNTGNPSNGGQTQTQLGITAKKELFNDRLIVQVGSEVDVAGGQSSSQGTPIIGNVSVEYLLTQDRRLRLQGFSRNEYEGLIDGQLTVSGIALIFTREFNKFKELWSRQVKAEVEKETKTKEDK